MIHVDGLEISIVTTKAADMALRAVFGRVKHFVDRFLQGASHKYDLK